MGQIWDFFISHFSTLWLAETKSWTFFYRISEKSLICPIWSNSDPLCAHIWSVCIVWCMTSKYLTSPWRHKLLIQSGATSKQTSSGWNEKITHHHCVQTLSGGSDWPDVWPDSTQFWQIWLKKKLPVYFGSLSRTTQFVKFCWILSNFSPVWYSWCKCFLLAELL